MRRPLVITTSLGLITGLLTCGCAVKNWVKDQQFESDVKNAGRYEPPKALLAPLTIDVVGCGLDDLEGKTNLHRAVIAAAVARTGEYAPNTGRFKVVNRQDFERLRQQVIGQGVPIAIPATELRPYSLMVQVDALELTPKGSESVDLLSNDVNWHEESGGMKLRCLVTVKLLEVSNGIATTIATADGQATYDATKGSVDVFMPRELLPGGDSVNARHAWDHTTVDSIDKLQVIGLACHRAIRDILPTVDLHRATEAITASR